MFADKQFIRSRQTPVSDATALLSASGLVLLSGLIISLYTVLVRHVTVRTNSQDCVNQTALDVASALSTISINDPVFGKVGLCDQLPADSNGGQRVTALNRLYATLATDARIADRLHMPFISKLVAADLRRAHDIQDKLTQALQNAVCRQPRDKAWQNLHIYEKARAVAASGHNPDDVFLDLRISLGYFPEAKFPSSVAAPSSTDEKLVFLGQYRPNLAIALPGNQQVMFYQIASKVQTCDAGNFFTARNSVITPSVVQIEATYKTTERERRIDIVRTRTATAIAGGAVLPATASVLMVSFPQGMPAVLTSLKDLLNASGKSGEWQQAVGGDVPGKGHLAAPIAVESPEMVPGEAAQMCFYHWLRALGPDVDADKAVALTASAWKSPPVAGDRPGGKSSRGRPNSALTKDMGARAFALFFQSGPGGVGQTALRNAFGCNPEYDPFPKSAIPLEIDAAGNCHLAGRAGFDRKLISDFLEAVYQTNLSCMESSSVGTAVSVRLEQAAAEIERDIERTQEDLDSISKRIARLEAQEQGAAELRVLRRNQASLQGLLSQQTLKRDHYKEIAARAQTVVANANGGALASFDLCLQTGKYARDGLFRIDGCQSFLVGHDQVFVPKLKPVTEEEIYDEAEPLSANAWTSKQFNVLSTPSPNTLAEGHSLSELKAAARQRQLPAPLFVVFDSRQLQSAGAPLVLTLPQSPFADSGLPEAQLAFYGQDAIRTGQNPQVGWSLLIRDAVASLADQSAPIASNRGKWCLSDDLSMGSCPGLAAEIQVRSPVPVMPELPMGSSLINPQNHERVSQIPPMPPTML